VATIYTIGFTKKSAATFFGILKKADIQRVLDIRVSPDSQLAGFAKRRDLQFFLPALCNAEYRYEPPLAPTKELMTAFKKNKGAWADYEQGFLRLMRERHVADALDRALFDTPTALLCSEATPEHCHRRLVAEYLKSKWGGLKIVHL
jgi:uncharacterized protein (DUF488 family)